MSHEDVKIRRTSTHVFSKIVMNLSKSFICTILFSFLLHSNLSEASLLSNSIFGSSDSSLQASDGSCTADSCPTDDYDDFYFDTFHDVEEVDSLVMPLRRTLWIHPDDTEEDFLNEYIYDDLDSVQANDDPEDTNVKVEQETESDGTQPDVNNINEDPKSSDKEKTSENLTGKANENNFASEAPCCNGTAQKIKVSYTSSVVENGKLVHLKRII